MHFKHFLVSLLVKCPTMKVKYLRCISDVDFSITKLAMESERPLGIWGTENIPVILFESRKVK